MNVEPGKTISHYKILSEIGKGGMGTVYLAQDTKLERKVAIKFLSKEWSRDKDKLKRFQQEAKAASALNHPNILTIYEIDELDGTPYISAEYINGTDVGTFAREKKLSLEKALDISIQIVAALKTAHDAGIVHRDIKPDNVMIREDGIVKILDFGLAKLTEKGHGERHEGQGTRVEGRAGSSETLITGSRGSPKTMPGVVMGTANYMSPEQARGKNVDQRADIFSFGALLYEMLTRVRPFDGETTSDVIAAVLTRDPAPVKELNDEIPARLGAIVDRSLKKKKDQRYGSSAELLEELETLSRHLQIEEIEKTILPEEKMRETKIFQATTAGKAKDRTAARSNGADSFVIRKSLAGKVFAVAAIVVAAGVIAFFGWNYFAGGDRQIDSVAVMPFTSDGANEDIEYLADGMTETLISSLTRIPNLSVKARSSVFRYKGKEIDPRTVSDELNVEAVLLGRVVQRGDDLALSLELVEARTENIIWSEKFDRKLSDLVSLQTEIARDVANKLRLTLSPSDRQNVTKTYTANSEANQLYLKGRFHWNKRNINDFEKAAAFFREAIEKDPKYALAYSGLADTYALMPLYGGLKPKKYMPMAKTSALKAIELDDGLAEAHASLGQIVSYYDYDWKRAETEYKKALQLNPNYAPAHLWYGELFAAKGDTKKCIEEVRKALALEPFSLVFNRMLGVALFWDGKYDEAIIQLKKTLEMFPEDESTKFNLANVYAVEKMYREAIDHYLAAGKNTNYSKEERRGAIDSDRWKVFQRMFLKELLEMKKKRFVPNFDIAAIYADLGEEIKALEYLEKSVDEREMQMLWTRNDPSFDSMRDNPRFQALMKKMGFPVRSE